MKLRRRRQLGTTTVEYAMLVSLVVVATIPALDVLGGAASASFDGQAVALSGTEVSASSAASSPTTTTTAATTTTTTTSTTTTTLNVAPTAAFTPSCKGLTCTFADDSEDDGEIVAWQWSYGDGAHASSPNGARKYAASGTYDVVLEVTDERGLTDASTQQVVVVKPPLVIAAVEALGTPGAERHTWLAAATVTVSDSESTPPPVEGVLVTADVLLFKNGRQVDAVPGVTCTTDLYGECSINWPALANNDVHAVTFTVVDVAHDDWDPDDKPSATASKP